MIETSAGFPLTRPGAQYDLDDDDAYRTWRDWKLDGYPQSVEEIIVEVHDPRKLTAAEKAALKARIDKANMAVYAGRTGDNPDKSIPLRFGLQFQLEQLDHNLGADGIGVTELEVKGDPQHRRYIPYSNRAIHWHTDGYYNELDRQVYGLVLHCVRPAARGGDNALLDNEIAYIHLRDTKPGYIRALLQPDTMTIPANVVDGEELRPARSGPVLNTDKWGCLHMRFTERARNIVWKNDAMVLEAIAVLEDFLHSNSPYIYRATLDSGQGLICNNVLHDRSGFEDDPKSPRLLYRLRYHDRMPGC